MPIAFDSRAFFCPGCNTVSNKVVQTIIAEAPCPCCPAWFLFSAQCGCPLQDRFFIRGHFFDAAEWLYSLQDWLKEHDKK